MDKCEFQERKTTEFHDFRRKSKPQGLFQKPQFP